MALACRCRRAPPCWTSGHPPLNFSASAAVPTVVSRWQWRSSLGPLQATCACDTRVVQRPKERCQKPLRRERLAGQAIGTEAAAPLPAMSEAPEVVALANTGGSASAVAAVAMSDARQTRGSREE